MARSVSLVVLRCADLAVAKRFYEAIGLTFVAERHGDGPEHWSCRLGGTVVELYPSAAGATSPPRIGFNVDDVASVVRATVAAGGRLHRAFDDASGTAVVVSPDGTKVELTVDSGSSPASRDRG